MCVPISDEKISLIGETFVLLFWIHLDEVYLSYIHRNKNNKMEYLDIDSFIAASLDSNDRQGISVAHTVNETVNSILLILLRGLINHWSNILSGDTLWINDYMVSE